MSELTDIAGELKTIYVLLTANTRKPKDDLGNILKLLPLADRLDAAAKEQAAEIERLRHHHCNNCGRRTEFISRCDQCLTKKLAGMERLIAEQAAKIERLRAILSRAVKDYQGDEWVPDAEAALAGGDA